MIVYCVEVHVVQGHEKDFEKASIENRKETRKETGNIRFDVLQQTGDPARFFLYEVYTSPEAVTAHKETPHYLKWRDTVAPWMAEPRKGVSHNICAPAEASEW